MYIYVELWKFRQAWLDLSVDERRAFMDNIGSQIQNLLDEGVESLAFAYNDDETPHPSGYDYIAVWKIPNKDLVEKFEKTVEDSGFHNYHEQVNARGPMVDLGPMINQHVELKR